ncbi:MAG: adenosylcobinamide-GDP ribazoletransferase [Lachnospiraceae bacterium]|nr:adenosylcobinamide-GDP ribazoletransferase [Lachnospiraceae bacterium]
MIRQLWNGCKISFAMYSRIPMPPAEWTDDNMKYSMCFFPLVGVVIGAVMYGWYLLCGILPFGNTFQTAVYLVIPVIISGGIHLDGLLDTADALSSWQTMERRLEILKDSNSGAFAIITGFVYFILYFGVMSQVDGRSIGVICVSFVLSRSLSGYSVVTFKKARNTGLAVAFANPAQKKTVQVTMIVSALICAGLLLWINPLPGAAVLAGGLLVFFYYRYMSMHYFGGITGDLCGFFTQVSELVMALSAVLVSVLVI